MSYDLFFYKRKGQQLTEDEIGTYLVNKLTPVNESGRQWFFENEDTDVYFSFDYNVPVNDPEEDEPFGLFADFEYSRFSFNLNYIRPNFFGREAFKFVEHFMRELDLLALDPQSKTNADSPQKITFNEMLATWGDFNLSYSATKFEEFELTYFPMDKSEDTWHYNFNRQALQKKLGDEYFVPKVFIMQPNTGRQAITVATWTHHIPTIIPPADYYLLNKEYKKFFRTVKESGLISYNTLIKNFGSYMSDFDFKSCKILHPDKALRAKDIFNGIKIEHQLTGFCARIDMQKLVNTDGTAG